jgi:hypothetical protein
MPGYFLVKVRPMSSAASPLICAVYQVSEPSLRAASSSAATSARARRAGSDAAAATPATAARRVMILDMASLFPRPRDRLRMLLS